MPPCVVLPAPKPPACVAAQARHALVRGHTRSSHCRAGEDSAPAGAGYFALGGKVTKTPPGGARRSPRSPRLALADGAKRTCSARSASNLTLRPFRSLLAAGLQVAAASRPHGSRLGGCAAPGMAGSAATHAGSLGANLPCFRTVSASENDRSVNSSPENSVLVLHRSSKFQETPGGPGGAKRSPRRRFGYFAAEGKVARARRRGTLPRTAVR